MGPSTTPANKSTRININRDDRAELQSICEIENWTFAGALRELMKMYRRNTKPNPGAQSPPEEAAESLAEADDDA